MDVVLNDAYDHMFHGQCTAALSNAGKRARACFCGAIDSSDGLSDVVDNGKRSTTRFDRAYRNVSRLLSSYRRYTKRVMPNGGVNLAPVLCMKCVVIAAGCKCRNRVLELMLFRPTKCIPTVARELLCILFGSS